MRTRKSAVIGLACLAAVAPFAVRAQPQRIDLLIKGGKVLTLDKTFSVKSAVAVKDGNIVAVGGDEIARKYQASKTIDLAGRVLMPGFMDTHLQRVASAVDVLPNLGDHDRTFAD